ncbi:hypothetical protein BN946_scf184675.g3 [Trametes cinnabarina]|uniref:Uncharacterized protein n=1 Tax=Pycnoporus cinnabarinus TaxID=5643 RepID=A0A060SSM2_PYCCI|nr:hypothetical protein BN946_scf184675.g3 [Trametes cinnabarina]
MSPFLAITNGSSRQALVSLAQTPNSTLSLPIRCEDSFSPLLDPFRLNLHDPLIAKHLEPVCVNGQEYCEASNPLAGSIWFRLTQLAQRIAAALHGFLPGVTTGCAPTQISKRSLEELGLDEPRIFQFLDGTQHRNPLRGRWPVEIWLQAWSAIQNIGQETEHWILHARQRTRGLLGSSTWIFDHDDMYVCVCWLDEQVARGRTEISVIPPYDPNHPYILPNATTNSCQALIPHPIYGNHADSALSLYQPGMVPALLEELENSCRALILHPIWSSEARNQMIVYGEPSVGEDQAFVTPPTPPNSPSLNEGSHDLITYEDIFGTTEEGMDEDE